MQPRRFRAPNLEAAYEQVREALGNDAIIVSTQSVRGGMLGVGGGRGVEVLATLPAEYGPGAPMASALLASRDEPALALDDEDELDLAPPFVNPLAGSARGPFGAYLRSQTAESAFADEAEASRERRSGAHVLTGFDPEVWDRVPPLPPPPGGAYDGDDDAWKAAAMALDPSRERLEPADDASAQPEVAAAAEPGERPRLSIVSGDYDDEGYPPGTEREHELLAAMREDLQALRAGVDRLERERRERRVEEGPLALRDARERLLEAGLAPALALRVLDQVADAITADATDSAIEAEIGRRLAAALPAAVALDFARRPLALILAGPSAAGKTTAAARLALHLQRDRGLRVVLAGTDVERAGAPQQLEAIGEAAGLDVRACYTPAELQALLEEPGVDVVVVDTAGHTGRRKDRMAELEAFANVAANRSVLLTLPATMQRADLARVTEAFAALRPAGLLLTRCDEASAFGGVCSAVAESGAGVAFTTHSERIGEPARAGDSHALAAAVLRGAWDGPRR